MIKGIDISEHQGKPDFAKVKKSGADFVMIRAGYGKYSYQKDKCFEDNYKGAKAAGLKVGAYWYSYAASPAEAVEEAEVFLRCIKGKTFEYPLALDIEDKCFDNVSNETVNKIIENFCKTCEKAGYYICVYSYASFLNNRVWEKVKKRFDVWVAHYGVSKPSYTGSYGMWQYSAQGRIDGIATNCDEDYCYTDYPSVIKKAGLNGFKSGKILDEKGYKKGDKGAGVCAVNELLSLAYARKIISVQPDKGSVFGAKTLKCVNEFLGKNRYTQNGLAGENFIKAIGKKLA